MATKHAIEFRMKPPVKQHDDHEKKQVFGPPALRPARPAEHLPMSYH
jgi:hypothetical protein